MNKFELYHPILTEHFALDWLTHSKVRDIFELRHDPEIAKASDRDIDATIEDTTTYVNQMMRVVMNNEALIWGSTLLEQVGFSAVASQTDNQNITLELNRH